MTATDEGAPRTARPDRHHVVLLVVVGLALVLRLAYVAGAKHGEELAGDQIYYSAQAHTIADGRWFEDPFGSGRPAADHPPLTALVAAPVSFGDDPVLAQRLLMAVLGAAVVGAIGLLGSRIGGRRTGVIAAVVAAIYANFWMNDGLVMSETLSALCVTGFLLVVYGYLDHPSRRRAALVGLLVGVCTLARAEMLLTVPLVVVPVMFARRFGAPLAWGERWVRLGAVVGVMVLTLVPWTVYNATRFERPVLISTNDGLALMGANCRGHLLRSGHRLLEPAVWRGAGGAAGRGPIRAARRATAEGLRYARAHLSRLPVVALAREGRVWSAWRVDEMVWLNLGEGRERWASWIGIVQWWLLAPLAVVGAVVLHRRQVPLLPLLAMVALVAIVALTLYGIPRFRIPAEVAVVVLAAAAIDRGLSVVSRRPAAAG